MSGRDLKNLEVLHAYLVTDYGTYSGPDALAASIPSAVAPPAAAGARIRGGKAGWRTRVLRSLPLVP